MQLKLLIILIIMVPIGCTTSSKLKQTLHESSTGVTPPSVEKIPKELTIHGDTRIDNYYWLNERENAKTLAYLNAENAYLDTVLKDSKNFRESLFQEMKARIKERPIGASF
jgi:oligopeptidase B